MAELTLSLRISEDSLSPLLAQLSAQLLQAPLDVRSAFLDRFERVPELAVFHLDRGAATRAGDLAYRLQPSDSLRELVRAFWAGEIHRG